MYVKINYFKCASTVNFMLLSVDQIADIISCSDKS